MYYHYINFSTFLQDTYYTSIIYSKYDYIWPLELRKLPL